MIKILVTGANGQLGKTLQDVMTSKQFDIDFKTSLDLDITDFDKVENYILKNNFDYVINCAAYTKVDKAEIEAERAFLINAKSVENMALSCKKAGAILIHISTDYVFDGDSFEPYFEEDIPNPINVYGKTKLAGERFIIKELDQYFILRTSWLYSKTHGNNFYKFIKEKVAKDEQLSIVDNEFGKPTETNLLVEKIIYLIVSNTQKYGIYHIAGKEAMSRYEFAKQIVKKTSPEKSHLVIPVTFFDSAAKRPKNSVLSTEKIDELTKG